MNRATMRCRPVRKAIWLAAATSVLAACGGGGSPDTELADVNASTTASTSTTSNNTTRLSVATAAATPADEAPVRASAAAPAVGTLRLVSTDSAGRAANQGATGCGISADGNVVAFVSASGNLVVGDNDQRDDVFVKNLTTGVTIRASLSDFANNVQLSGPVTCGGLSANGRYVVFGADTPVPAPGTLYGLPPEPALFVRDLSSGRVTRITPPLASLPFTAGFTFQAISDNGQRVAFLAQPTTRYLGGYLTVADGPARPFVYDISSGGLRNLSNVINLASGPDLQLGLDISTLALSSDGSQLAFATPINQPRAGDNNGNLDVFVLNLANDALRSVFSPAAFIYGFRANDTQLLYRSNAASSLGVDGIYASTLSTGAVQVRVADRPGFALTDFGADPTRLSFSGDGFGVAFSRYANGRDEAFARRLNTGQEQRLAVTAAGVVGNGRTTYGALLSADGSNALFNSDATNLVRLPRGTFPYQVYVKTVGTAAP
jgi:Tol biopolymer transport system component